jgi:hypothetical protein
MAVERSIRSARSARPKRRQTTERQQSSAPSGVADLVLSFTRERIAAAAAELEVPIHLGDDVVGSLRMDRARLCAALLRKQYPNRAAAIDAMTRSRHKVAGTIMAIEREAPLRLWYRLMSKPRGWAFTAHDVAVALGRKRALGDEVYSLRKACPCGCACGGWVFNGRKYLEGHFAHARRTYDKTRSRAEDHRQRNAWHREHVLRKWLAVIDPTNTLDLLAPQRHDPSTWVRTSLYSKKHVRKTVGLLTSECRKREPALGAAAQMQHYLAYVEGQRGRLNRLKTRRS